MSSILYTYQQKVIKDNIFSLTPSVLSFQDNSKVGQKSSVKLFTRSNTKEEAMYPRCVHTCSVVVLMGRNAGENHLEAAALTWCSDQT